MCKLSLTLFFSGGQAGEYFGAAVVVGDFNGDGADDLIVGSPLHTHHKVS